MRWMKIGFLKNLIINRKKNFQIIQFTSNNSNNPYYTMIGDYMSNKGFNFRYSTDVEEIMELIEEKITIIHIHQLSPFYQTDDRDESKLKALKILDQFRDIKSKGAYLVFTMHNPLPHNRIHVEIDEMVNKGIYTLADAIIVHGKYVKEFLITDQNVTKPIFVVLHPSYKEYYGIKSNKEQARKDLGLHKDAVIFGNIGNIKPYKGLEFIIKSFEKFSKQHKSKDIHLYLAGAAKDKNYLESLKKISGSMDNVTILNRNLTESELITSVSALDYSIFAFKDIWASGSVVLSISYDVPVIVPEMGCMGDYVKHGWNGFLYSSDDLTNTLNLAVNSKNYDYLTKMCKKYSETHKISKFAEDTYKVYKKVLN
jgi:beta-1,4-mannosyltransferase